MAAVGVSVCAPTAARPETQLLPSAIQDLERSGIAIADAERAGMFSVDDASTLFPEFDPAPALVIPYFHPRTTELMTFDRGPFCRLRLLGEIPKAGGFVKHKSLRYLQPKKSGVHAYFAPVRDWKPLLEDKSEPVIITEGEKKALAAVLAGLPVIALGGVYNFMDAGELLPELANMVWKGRDTFICFDSDAAMNPDILAAEARLVDELQRKRGARCYIVRIPQDGDDKVGLDDFLVRHGAAALVTLVRGAESLDALDAKVVSLNKSVAWIERENMIYDLDHNLFLTKDSFTTGSRFSSLKHITRGSGQRAAPKTISVAKTWLTHPHAQRFSEAIFRPGEGASLHGNHGPALNMWKGWEPGEGDVQPFLDLTEFLFQKLPPEHRDLPLNLITYKAQNPQEKIPLALVLVGPQGCGKTLWSEVVRDAFDPYGVTISSKSFYAEFQGWLEQSLIGTMNEVEPEDMAKGGEQLKALISDLQRPMNEKYRPARQINSYTTYILTSNKREVGAFAADDRRMIVVDCPLKREPAFYNEYLKPWKLAGGAKALLGWMLARDLKGWTPPATAPMTAEKFMSYMESLTPAQRLAEDMRTSTEQTIKLWLDQATGWARAAETANDPRRAVMARAVLDAVKHYQIRPWYTPEELAMMFPALVEALQGVRTRAMASGALSRELRNAGVPYLQSKDDPRGFRWKGQIRQFLVVCEPDSWTQPLTQEDFERYMAGWPSYGTLNARKAA